MNSLANVNSNPLWNGFLTYIGYKYIFRTSKWEKIGVFHDWLTESIVYELGYINAQSQILIFSSQNY